MSCCARTCRRRSGPPLWNSAFLPAMHQGTFIPSKVERPDQIVGKDFDPKKLVSFINNKSFTLPEQRRELDLLANRSIGCSAASAAADPQLEAAISSMEVGLSDADRGAGRVRHPQGESGHARAVRAGQHRARLPDGRAAGRARRADGAGLLRQGRSVGCPLRHPAAPQEREGLGPAVRRGHQGSEVTRPLQGHARRLRLGVRPHAGRRSRRHGRRAERPRSQSLRLQHVAGRRRREGRA